MGQAPHEKLRAYQKSLEAAALLRAIARAIPADQADLRDELRRASTSVVLNLAEGGDEFSPAEKARFYRMSRRSAGECLAVLDLLTVEGMDLDATLAKDALTHVMALTTTLVLRALSMREP
ncbi:MAG: hypothetical protein QOE90_1613 [Thermoplasmata archaeon]|jgi:four helix bundle protein|nr:hypothetical protein [Thermoplasmata archaeon]